MPTERGATGWTLYLAASLFVSLATTSGALIGFIFGLIDGDGFDGELISIVLVWGFVWLIHWYAWVLAPPSRGASLHLYLGAALGLGFAAGGAGSALTNLVWRWFDARTGVAVGRVDASDVALGIVVALVGLAVWSWHWLVHGVRSDRTPSWLTYVMLYGVLGGLTVTLVGAGRAIFLVLEWTLGDPETTSALTHYRDVGPALAAALVGLAVWRYHASLVGPIAGRVRSDVDRIYDSIVAGLSLATVAGALSVLVVALFQLASPAAASAGESGGDVLLGALTLLVIGGPLWSLTWSRMQRHARVGSDEAASTPRRVYLFSVLGVAGAVAFGALISLLIVLFETWLDERTGSLADALQWPVALLVTTGTVAAYHFAVARAERDARAAAERRDVLLVWSGNGAAGELASRTNARVRVFRRTDEVPGPLDVDAIVSAIDEASGSQLLVLAGRDGVTVVPYE